MPGTPREIALLTNPAAGRGRAAAISDAVATRLRDAGLTVRRMQGADAEEALTLAHDAVDSGVQALVVVGGDGLAHLAVQALAGTGVPLGIVPAGTGNDVARSLDIPRRDPLAAADRVIGGRTRTVDLARCGSRYVVTVLAAGFDAIVNERANAMAWPRGQARYHLATLAELRVLSPRRYVLDLDGEVVERDAVLVAVGNGPSYGGGLRITEPAVLDDGYLDVVVVKEMGRARLLRAYPRLVAGTHTALPEYEHHRVRRVGVAAPGIVAYADGERFGALPLTIESAPGALKVLA